MIVTYNKEQVGDVLMLTLKNSGEAKLAVERKGKVARVYREDKQETVAWNILMPHLSSPSKARAKSF